MLILLSILALMAFCIAKLRKHPADKLPGPPAVPILGNIISCAPDEIMNKFSVFARDYWPLYRTWQLNTPVIHLLLPEHVEQVLASNKNTQKSRDCSFVESWLGTSSLFTSNGEKWQNRRKKLAPSFCNKKLQHFVPIFNSNASILAEKLSQLAAVADAGAQKKQQAINIYPLVTLCAFHIICETAVGQSINAHDNSQHISDYINSMQKVMGLVVYRVMRPWLYPACIFCVTPSGNEFRRCLHTLQSFTENVVSARKKERSQCKEIKVSDSHANGLVQEKDNDTEKQNFFFVDTLLDVRSEGDVGPCDQDICNEVDAFMFAGIKTTSTVISWALFYLGTNLEIQEQCYDELLQIFKDGSDREILLSDVGLMNLLERVIKETLRLRPPTFKINRTLDEEIILNEISYPKGTNVHLHVYDIHRNPAIYPEPDKFNPDRFLPECERSRHPFAYIPFSAGPRNCIGQNFAMAEMKVVLATLIRRFRFESVDPVKHSQFTSDLILRPKHGICLKIMSRCTSSIRTSSHQLTANLPKHICNIITSDETFATADPRCMSLTAKDSEMKFWI